MCFCVIYIVLFFEGFVLLVLILYTQVATQSKTVKRNTPVQVGKTSDEQGWFQSSQVEQ